MKLLHTSDWHLGRMIESQSRLDEQAAFLDALIGCACQENVDVILVAGDLYDTYNPPARAEQLFFEKVKVLADGGNRLVVIVSGNHDQPVRLGAASSWAAEHGVILCTDPEDQWTSRKIGRFWIEGKGPGALTVETGDEKLNLALLPFPSESRLGELLAASGEEDALQQAYTAKVGALLQERCAHFTEDIFGVIVSHLFVSGGESSDSERTLQWGGAYTVFSDAFPAAADYIALGHLHKPQAVPGLKGRGRYSGSPLQYSRSEIGYAKSVTLLSTQKQQPLALEEIFMDSVKPVEVWRAGSISDAEARLMAEGHRNAWVYLEIETDQPLTSAEIKRLKGLCPALLSIEPIFEAQETRLQEAVSIEQMDVHGLFGQFYEREYGAPPDPELMKRFAALLLDDASEEAEPA